MSVIQGWQLEGQGPQAYERYLVPAFFDACAQQLLDLAAPDAGVRLLDVACGTGILARRAAARLGASGAVTGIDVNDAMLEVAAESAEDGEIEWLRGSAMELPLPDASFDVVCCQQGLQFFSDPAAALREMRRVLAPGGRVALAVWRSLDHHPVFADLADALGRHLGEEAAADMRSPFAGPGRDESRSLMADAGFGEIAIRIGVISVRFPSAEEFLRQEAMSSPLASAVAALGEGDRQALAADVRESLGAYADDDGVAFPMQTWLITARQA